MKHLKMKHLKNLIIALSLSLTFSTSSHAIEFSSGQITLLRVGANVLVAGITPAGGSQKVTLAFKNDTNSFDAMASMLSDAYQANDAVQVQIGSNGLLEYVYPDFQ